MTKMLKLIQPLKISNEIYLPVGTIMDESTWCDFIGRKGGIDVNNSSDSEWWEDVSECFINNINPCLFYVVAYNSEDNLDQITIGLKTYDEAKHYRDGNFCKNKYPNAFIVCSLNEKLTKKWK